MQIQLKENKLNRRSFKTPAWGKVLIENNDCVNITLLKRPIDLINEGQIMHNCVASYMEGIQDQTCLILHYNNPETEQTATIDFHNHFSIIGLFNRFSQTVNIKPF